MRAFVTGATGFIGRRLVDRLHREGVKVIALVRSTTHNLPEGVQTLYGDILFPDSLGEAGFGCDRCYHLAAMITFNPRQKDELLRVNGQGTANILTAARRWNIERTVVVSSACTIGLSYNPTHVLDENAPLAETLILKNPYMASKLLTERETERISKEQTVVMVNPTTVYGPGDWTLNSGTLVLKIAKAGIMPVPPGGSNVVDVDDVVAGIVAAGEYGQSGRRYILGGENLPFARIFSTIADVVEHRPLLIPVPYWMRRPITGTAWIAGRITGNRFLTPQIVGDMFAFKYYSNERAKRELGWMPRYSFQETVKRAWDFYCQEGLV